jgi:hypothetical protein
MKIRINKNGYLEIERIGKWKRVLCPLDSIRADTACSTCGDWCALFGEPEESPVFFESDGTSGTGELVELELCHKTIVVNKKNFEDLR